jgi:O-methyltransferase involved in polyketide biosynthesis
MIAKDITKEILSEFLIFSVQSNPDSPHSNSVTVKAIMHVPDYFLAHQSQYYDGTSVDVIKKCMAEVGMTVTSKISTNDYQTWLQCGTNRQRFITDIMLKCTEMINPQFLSEFITTKK